MAGINIPSQPGPTGQIRGRNKKVSEHCYYAYRLHIRPQRLQPALFWGGKLLQQYIVDAWASIEQNMLNWVRYHQKELRADVYQGLADAVASDHENIGLENQGQHIILPSSHIGSD